MNHLVVDELRGVAARCSLGACVVPKDNHRDSGELSEGPDWPSERQTPKGAAGDLCPVNDMKLTYWRYRRWLASENGKDCRVRKRTTRARQEPAIHREKLLTAQRPRTYTHPTRPIKLLGAPNAYRQFAPTGQAPVVYAARCLHVPPGSNA